MRVYDKDNTLLSVVHGCGDPRPAHNQDTCAIKVLKLNISILKLHLQHFLKFVGRGRFLIGINTVDQSIPADDHLGLRPRR